MEKITLPALQQQIITNIFHLRGTQVMLDSDIASLYNVETKVLNQAVKRNLPRFPDSFRFQLSPNELSQIPRSQIVTLDEKTNSLRGKNLKYLPYAFTEQGISMLSAILRSDTAVEISIHIINAFVEMRKFITTNALLFQRIETLEQKQITSEQQISVILNALNQDNIKPKQGIFYNGQIFDAYVFVSDLIKHANKSILLIDNYIDESVLTLLSKKQTQVIVKLYTQKISKQLLLDVEKFNQQYPHLEIKEFRDSHDRFLIIDNKDIYHIGASLKDLGKKWFAFSKFEKQALELLKHL
jgi:phage regulator Rha-like protein